MVASITDHRDFYHQASVTSERAHTHLLPFRFTSEELSGTEAFLEYSQRELKKGKGRIEEVGDRLGFDDVGKRASDLPDGFFAGFKSLVQGDHLGVEFALAAHQGLLESAGLLRRKNK